MITKDQLNDDQQASFDQMTMEGGISEKEALEFIQEFCIDKGYTGLKCSQFRLTPQGRMAALDLLPEMPAVEPHRN